VVASFLIDPTVIWLDFEAPGLPESRKIEKKMLLFFRCFSSDKKIRPGSVFMDFGVHCRVSFGAPGCKTDPNRVFFFCSFSGGAHSKFGLAFSLKKHVFYEGVFQNLAFCSRVEPKVPQKGQKRYLK
jgi:hypothetical protein